jgi:hypothetical protein
LGPTVTPGVEVSTTKLEMPRPPRSSALLRAKTTKRSAIGALVM